MWPTSLQLISPKIKNDLDGRIGLKLTESNCVSSDTFFGSLKASVAQYRSDQCFSICFEPQHIFYIQKNDNKMIIITGFLVPSLRSTLKIFNIACATSVCVIGEIVIL